MRDIWRSRGGGDACKRQGSEGSDSRQKAGEGGLRFKAKGREVRAQVSGMGQGSEGSYSRQKAGK